MSAVERAMHEAAWSDVGQPLPYALTLPVLGISTRFTTNAPSVLALVEEAFGVWRALPDADVAAEPASVRILVSGDAATLDFGSPIAHATDDTLRFIAWTVGGVAASDPARREAIVRATPALVADRARVRAELLESVVLALLSCDDRHPVHAAAVGHHGRALLFAAPSGTGKSTLAYACHAAGLDLLADDHVRIQLEPTLRVWGWPARVRLFAETAARLDATHEVVRGEASKVVVDARRGMTAARLVARAASVCLLSRDGGPLALEPLTSTAIARALDAQLAPGFDRFPARWPAVRDTLAARGGWRLNLSSDPHEAVRVVRTLLKAGDSVTR